MTVRRWSYPPEFRAPLLAMGLDPRVDTPPALVRDAVNDLYRFELRRLRDRLRAGQEAKASYLDRVVALRKKYWLLTFQPDAWETICGEKHGE